MSSTRKNTRALPSATSSETSDAYAHVIARSGRWRIIRCGDDIQYIVQFRRAGSAVFPWRARAYVLHASALPATLERLCGPSEDRFSLLAVLKQLNRDDARGPGQMEGAR